MKDSLVRRIIFREVHASVFYSPVKIEGLFLTVNFIGHSRLTQHVKRHCAFVKFRRLPYLSGKFYSARHLYFGNEFPSVADIRLMASTDRISERWTPAFNFVADGQ